MPAVKTYIVTQERQVKVTASSPTEAVETAKFSLGENNEDNRDNHRPLWKETSVSSSEY